ncbi:phage baseplate protein [Emergencia sp. 1XD21-10]|uniref:phage distal tail protein domain-containing protein n=1 Tax=Emergencia sp. 1XD21-10 TaxID=2304569 RepID=UPI0013797660|nr:phage baseplate protein [Emergencia sp. 1XD21-10]NCE98397.1 hypothetical protein [Emergencia sp. 1XD21-10]
MASKFYLMNEKGARKGMNSAEDGFFTQPSGFGIKYDADYLKVGDLWINNNMELAQPELSGTLVFPKRMYNTFQDFVAFVTAAKSLVLIYEPSGVGVEYFADVDLVSIEKGGYNMRQQFQVPLTFKCKSLFYTEEEFEYRIQRAEREVRWDFKWETRFNDLNYVYFSFHNDGHVKSPFVVSFTGYCTNPILMVYQDNKLVHQVRFNISLRSDEKLTFSTFDDDLFIEVNGEDRKDCLDFVNDNFFKLPQGDCDIYFRCDAGKMNNIVMNLEKYYKGV